MTTKDRGVTGQPVRQRVSLGNEGTAMIRTWIPVRAQASYSGGGGIRSNGPARRPKPRAQVNRGPTNVESSTISRSSSVSIEVLFARGRRLDNPGASSTVSQLLYGPRFLNIPKSRALPLLICFVSANAEAADASRLDPDRMRVADRVRPGTFGVRTHVDSSARTELVQNN